MSRKLIFASGMLTCFSCETLTGPDVREELKDSHTTVAMEDHLLAFIKQTPLEILARFVMERGIKRETAIKLFSSYDAFLALLNDPDKRRQLKQLPLNEVGHDKTFEEVRQFARTFQEGLTALFFQDDELLRELTIFYGVF